MAIFARIQGDVFRMQHREGTVRDTGEAYSMDIAHVLVPNAGISEVTLPRRDDLNRIMGGALPQEGQSVDWLVEVAQGPRGLRVTLLRDENYEGYKSSSSRSAWSSAGSDADQDSDAA